MKVWDWARIELATPRSAVRHVTDCIMWPGLILDETISFLMDKSKSKMGASVSKKFANYLDTSLEV